MIKTRDTIRLHTFNVFACYNFIFIMILPLLSTSFASLANTFVLICLPKPFRIMNRIASKWENVKVPIFDY